MCAAPSYRHYLRKDPLPDLGFQGVAHDQINLDPEQVAQVVLQFDEPEQTGRLGEGDEDVQVAVGPVLVADIGAEEAKGRDMVTTDEGRQVPPQDFSEIGHISLHRYVPCPTLFAALQCHKPQYAQPVCRSALAGYSCVAGDGHLQRTIAPQEPRTGAFLVYLEFDAIDPGQDLHEGLLSDHLVLE